MAQPKPVPSGSTFKQKRKRASDSNDASQPLVSNHSASTSQLKLADSDAATPRLALGTAEDSDAEDFPEVNVEEEEKNVAASFDLNYGIYNFCLPKYLVFPVPAP